MERIRKSDEMAENAQAVINQHKDDLGWIEEDGIKIAYVYSDKAKKQKSRTIYGECKKTDAVLKALSEADFVITFYEPNTRRFTDKQLYILMYHELLHAAVKNGSTVIEPHDYVIEDFEKIVKEYGIGWAEDQQMTIDDMTE